MKKIIYLCIFIIFFVFLFPVWEIGQIINLSFSDPIKDAEKHIKDGDIGLFGVMSVGLYAPGVELDETPLKIIKVLPFTTDYRESFSSHYLNVLSKEYAKEFNLYITGSLSKNCSARDNF